MHQHLRSFAGLALPILLLAAPGLALAHGEGPQQIVDGYRVTLVVPEKGWYTGANPVEVILWDAAGMTVDATVTVAALAYAPADDGHSAAHGEAADTHDTSAAPADGHADAGAAHADDHSSDGRGLIPGAVPLVAGAEPDVYAGELAFDEAGTYSVSVVFTIDGQERGAIFDVTVAQSRPRGLVLGGFALVNALAVGAAGWLKYRNLQKPARKPARPTAHTITEE